MTALNDSDSDDEHCARKTISFENRNWRKKMEEKFVTFVCLEMKVKSMYIIMYVVHLEVCEIGECELTGKYFISFTIYLLIISEKRQPFSFQQNHKSLSRFHTHTQAKRKRVKEEWETDQSTVFWVAWRQRMAAIGRKTFRNIYFCYKLQLVYESTPDSSYRWEIIIIIISKAVEAVGKISFQNYDK